ncbi:hypothetical protein LVJ94_24110 [Pendulispora rubella]|uniref:Uncharacterized protein n=1 Tax=Pendulispora rubella TaxID=2741070 RepID=A0ABZ2LM90_9BACT
MRRSSMIYSTVLATAFVGAIWGCGDLLHGTDFTEKSKFIQGQPNFCEWDIPTAQKHAVDACTMLLSCENGFSADAPNAYGECIKRAIMAYSCEANPNLPVRGKTREFWDCLWRAQTCEAADPAKENDVASCFKTDDGGAAPSVCQNAPGFINCVGPQRAECRNGSPRGNFDPCVASGRMCGKAGTEIVCAGSNNGSCTKTGCEDKRLHWCAPDSSTPQDHGIDCENFGDQDCIEIDAGVAACKPSVPQAPDGGVDAGLKPGCPNATVTCQGYIAVGCPSGIEERVDCKALGLLCTALPGGDSFDVSRACGDPKATCVDRCEGGNVIACRRGGNETTIKCADYGLGQCITQRANDGKEQATCGPPLPRP